MLLGAKASVSPLRLPAAEELSTAQRTQLRERLTAALAAWEGAGLVGITLGKVERVPHPQSVNFPPDVVAWANPWAALILPPAVAAALVCVNLGSTPDVLGQALTTVDLAVLDVWARRALQQVVGCLRLPPGDVNRAQPHEVMANWSSSALLAQLDTPAGEAALIIAWPQALPGQASGGRRSTQRPQWLLGIRVSAEVRLQAAEVPLADLVAASVGDVLLLGPSSEVDVGLYVGGQRVARGRPGVRGGHLAMKVEHLDQHAHPPHYEAANRLREA